MLKKSKTSKGYLLGKDKDGNNYYLAFPSWDCDWYWGFGYINHANGMFHWDGETFSTIEERPVNTVDGFTNFIKESPLYKPGKNERTWEKYSEVYKLADLMKSFYTAKEYANLLHSGHSYFTSSKDVPDLKNNAEYVRINTEVIPTLLRAIHELLAPEGTPLALPVPKL